MALLAIVLVLAWYLRSLVAPLCLAAARVLGHLGRYPRLAARAPPMITFTGLVFSITIVTLQLTSSQFSPRVLRTFLRDRFNQLTLGLFIATFVSTRGKPPKTGYPTDWLVRRIPSPPRSRVPSWLLTTRC